MTTLPPPRRAISEVLLALIEGREVKERKFRFNGFRDIISQLKNHYKLPLRHVDIESEDAYGTVRKYRKHFLLRMHVRKATALYNKINGR